MISHLSDSIFAQSYRGELEKVRTFLEANRSEKLLHADEHGMTLLHWAARGGNVAIAILLIENGHPIAPLDLFGQAPLHIAVCSRSDEMVLLLLQTHLEK